MLKNNIKELLEHNIIDEVTANKIIAFYENKKPADSNKMMMLFGILGSILAGLGIWLIIAHNWDSLPNSVKLTFAFIPVLISQAVSGYAYVKKQKSKAWRESTSALLFIAIGASLAMISQIYHLQGSEKDFMLTWVLLALPTVYVLDSSIASLFYLLGISYYSILDYNSTETGTYFSGYWLLLVGLLPFYIYTQQKPKMLTTLFLHWAIPISVIIMLGSVFQSSSLWIFSVFAFLFAFYLQLSKISPLLPYTNFQNGYRIIGYLGLLIMLYMSSFESFWEHVHSVKTEDLSYDLPFFFSCFLLISSASLVIYNQWKKSLSLIYVSSIFFFLFLLIPMPTYVPTLFFNFYVLGLGVYTVKNGIQNHFLGIMNLGISILSILILCRFFDAEIPFIIKGFLFLLVGIFFFLANYYFVKKPARDAA